MEPFLVVPFGYLAGSFLSVLVPEEVEDGQVHFRYGHWAAACMIVLVIFSSPEAWSDITIVLAIISLVAGLVVSSIRLNSRLAFLLIIAVLVVLKAPVQREVVIAVTVLAFLDGMLLAGIESGRLSPKKEKRRTDDHKEYIRKCIREQAVKKLPFDIGFVTLLEIGMIISLIV